jgi:hypothetical protein
VSSYSVPERPTPVAGGLSTLRSTALSDLSAARTWPEFAKCLNRIHVESGLTYSDLERAGRAHARAGGRELKRSTVSEVLLGKRSIAKPLLESLVVGWGLADGDRDQVLTTWQRLAEDARRVPARGIRFDEASPREVGIHAAIATADTIDDLPRYVPREYDDRLQRMIAAGADHGCFVVLVGRSSTGKTRSLYEAILNVAPNWWLIQPNGTQEILNLLDQPVDRSILWLDELHRFLGATPALTKSIVQMIANTGTIVVGTLWSQEYTARKGLRVADSSDQHADDRALLEYAEVISVLPALKDTEREQADKIATIDSRIRRALESRDAGLTQVLAAGPDLVHQWEQAPPYAQAVITVAADARRLGVHSPLPSPMLRDAMTGYLTAAERVISPSSWLHDAIPYAEKQLNGGVSALSRVAGRESGIPAGYVAADYLAQHVREVRRNKCPADSTWEALIRGAVNIDDLRRLRQHAKARMRYRHAEQALRRLSALGDGSSPRKLANLLIRQDRLDEAIAILRELIRTMPGDKQAAEQLARTVALQERADDLRANTAATERLPDLLYDGGRKACLRARADRGDAVAADDLAELLAVNGSLGELRDLADAGHQLACGLLADLLATHHKLDELNRRAERGDEAAIRRLTKVDIEAAESADENAVVAQIAALRSGVDSGDQNAADQLTMLLFELRREGDLRAEVDAGTPRASERLVALLTAEYCDHAPRMADIRRLRAFGLHADGTPVIPGEST